jgi:cytochrome oxidase Cu insertion factor (SCO1/SenC/PrrC family)
VKIVEQTMSNNQEKKPGTNNNTLWIMIFLFALPYAAAMYFYLNRDSFDFEQNNYGTIISPLKKVSDIELKTIENNSFKFSSLKGKWVMVSIGSSHCEESCQKNIYHMRQIKTAAGKDRKKIERVFLLTDMSDIDNFKSNLTEYKGMYVIQNIGSEYNELLTSFSFNNKDTNETQDVNDGLFFIDPMGNYMMGYPGGSDAIKVLHDLQRLLKVSRAGNMI